MLYTGLLFIQLSYKSLLNDIAIGDINGAGHKLSPAPFVFHKIAFVRLIAVCNLIGKILHRLSEFTCKI